VLADGAAGPTATLLIVAYFLESPP